MNTTSAIKILYIEDEPAFRELFRLAVEGHGHSVDVAATGEEGLALFTQNPYDIVAIDYHLPGMTGIEVSRKLLAVSPDLPLLMVTGKGDQRLAIEAMTLGIANYVIKDDEQTYIELVPSIIIHLIERSKQRQRQIEADRALQESEQKYRSLVAASPVCIHEIDLDGKLLSMNPAGLKMMGVEDEAKICGLEYLRVPVPEDRNRISGLMDRARQGEGSSFEFSAVGETGPLSFSSSFEPIRDDDGVVIKLMGMTQDITERRRAEEAVRVSEGRFRDLIEGSIQGIFIHDEGKPLFANQSCADIFGYGSPDEILMHFRSHSHVTPHDRARLERYTKIHLGGGQAPTAYEFEGVKKDGSLIWLDNRIRRITWDGRPAVQWSIVDITARKKAEKALSESQARLTHAAKLARVGHWAWDEIEYRSSYCSEEYALLLGITVDEYHKAASTLEGAIGLIHPDDQDIYREVMRAAEEAKSGYEITMRYPQPDGSIRYVKEIAEAVLDADGRHIQTVGATMDITEHKLAVDAIQTALIDAERANQAKSDFLAAMSHEFRTPLNAILGFSEMMRAQCFGPLGSHRYKEYANDIYDSGAHMLALVTDILDFSTNEDGKRAIVKRTIDVNELLGHCITASEQAARDAGINLSMDFPDDMPSLFADRRSVIKIVLNLLSNAVKYTDRNGTITVSVMAADQGTTIRVADTGAGIAADRLPRIMDPFVQTYDNPHIAQKGAGLGLSIVKSLAEAHDAELSIHSELDTGTTVAITFPPQGAIIN